MSRLAKSRTAPHRPATANHLIASLAPADRTHLTRDLEPVRLAPREVLYEANAKIEHVYFPTTGCISMVNTTPDGSVGVGTIGLEGMVGVPVLLCADSEPSCAMVQVEGQAQRISTSAFCRVIEQRPEVRRTLLRYALALFNQIRQSVPCNRLHSLESRCARWLLMTHDRAEGDTFELTQEFLSYMLGVHRPAVTLAAGLLQRAGCIRYTRGHITVTNRAGLESASCCCYQATRDNFRALAS